MAVGLFRSEGAHTPHRAAGQQGRHSGPDRTVSAFADRTTILEKVGEIEQLIAVAENKLRRLRPFAERGAVPQGQVNDLESELEGLRARRETTAIPAPEIEVLRAPTDGIITSAKVVPGQVIQPQDVLFQIADPKSLWVEALAYGEIDLSCARRCNGGRTQRTTDCAVLSRNEPCTAATRVSRSFRHPGAPDRAQYRPAPDRDGPGRRIRDRPDLSARRRRAEQQRREHRLAAHRPGALRAKARSHSARRCDARLVAAGLNERERIVVRAADLINQIR